MGFWAVILASAFAVTLCGGYYLSLDIYRLKLLDRLRVKSVLAAHLAALRAALPTLPEPLPAGPRYDRILQHLLYRQLERNLTENAANVYLQDMADLVAMRSGLEGLTFYPLYVLDISKLQWKE